MSYKLFIDGKYHSSYEKYNEVKAVRNTLVRVFLNELYNNDSVDKYVFEDWLSDELPDHIYIDEGCGKEFDIECDVKEFKTVSEAIAYGQDETKDFYKKGFAWEKIKVNGENVILCKDCRQYQDYAYGFFNEMIDKFKLDCCPEDFEWDLVSLMEKSFGCKFVDVYDEF